MAGITIQINVDKGTLIKRLSMFKREIKVGLYPAWARIAIRMKREMISLAPVDTGLLVKNIESLPRVMGVHGISRAIDPKNGYNYAGIQHWGGYASGMYGPHMITAKLYMVIPLANSVRYIEEELDSEIAKIIARCGL